ncbi:MAG: hypothetical protein HC836_31600 [Richelia sp. RM2_1_2]|nr:hypothetical protein [Richelia sp. RM2_1_2]
MSVLSFRSWLTEFHRGQDTSLGDLYADATRVYRKPFQTNFADIWEGETVESLKSFMQKSMAGEGAWDVFYEAEREYNKYVKSQSKQLS